MDLSNLIESKGAAIANLCQGVNTYEPGCCTFSNILHVSPFNSTSHREKREQKLLEKGTALFSSLAFGSLPPHCNPSLPCLCLCFHIQYLAARTVIFSSLALRSVEPCGL